VIHFEKNRRETWEKELVAEEAKAALEEIKALVVDHAPLLPMTPPKPEVHPVQEEVTTHLQND
jgi:hypothetical protein